jgi:hypothetical protein
MRRHTIISALLGLGLGAAASFSQAALLASSTFDSGGEGWGSFSFAGGGDPNFGGAVGGASAVLFNGANGNPAGSIEKADPDEGWQYFVAPGAGAVLRYTSTVVPSETAASALGVVGTKLSVSRRCC